ncbi:uncharacterized protein BO87DRAFT_121181 [Aspergillus neoniger CBS 115656]|uniref:RNI-like protein n=1 Tax=Aspergillus neoniger (strain CBS 115656) TaxID=1448310 RepID=A0A318YGY3_ASPNB|nr:hypothetical protein BO87DRAFT_121181 [Aspergillus neoniger CBS 115656]PYH31820.1 hypothetical protein BO87DRAFT_121181 [Aspergillus neoniger CBS 115656]
MRLSERKALAVRELSICSFSGRPLGLGCSVPHSCPGELQVSENLETALERLRNCQTLRVSVAGIKTAGYGPAWLGAVDATLTVLEVFSQAGIPLKSIEMDFRTDDAAALLHDGFKHRDYNDIPFSPFGYDRLLIKDVSLSLNASIAGNSDLCRRIFSPLWVRKAKMVSLDFGNSYGGRCVLDFLCHDKRFRARYISVLKLRGAAGMCFSKFAKKLHSHHTSLRILSMENVRFKRCDWPSLLHQLRTDFHHLRELHLTFPVEKDSMFAHDWRWKRRYRDPQFKVTYNGPRKNGVVTALEELADGDPLLIRD